MSCGGVAAGRHAAWNSNRTIDPELSPDRQIAARDRRTFRLASLIGFAAPTALVVLALDPRYAVHAAVGLVVLIFAHVCIGTSVSGKQNC